MSSESANAKIDAENRRKKRAEGGQLLLVLGLISIVVAVLPPIFILVLGLLELALASWYFLRFQFRVGAPLLPVGIVLIVVGLSGISWLVILVVALGLTILGACLWYYEREPQMSEPAGDETVLRYSAQEPNAKCVCNHDMRYHRVVSGCLECTVDDCTYQSAGAKAKRGTRKNCGTAFVNHATGTFTRAG